MTHPLPAFHFQVDWGGTRVGFSEVSGLEAGTAVIEYREGASPNLAPRLVPGLHRPGRVTLKRGIVPGDNELFAWFATAGAGSVERRDVTVSLLGEAHEPKMVWKLKDAWPAALSAAPLDAHANEVAIESLELVCEGIVREAP